MTAETYSKHHFHNSIPMTEKEHTGKHEIKHYSVWVVYTAAGPQETVSVYGLENVADLVANAWDYSVSTNDGRLINDSVIQYYINKRRQSKND